jgi:platelet-activating factor acetylhydrolase IB subunit alpha
MLDYLYNAGFMKTFNELRMEAPEVVCIFWPWESGNVLFEVPFQQADFMPDPSSPASGLLVKKWTSIIRMQRKVRGVSSCD